MKNKLVRVEIEGERFMKLGDKVQFSKHYQKTHNYLDTSGDTDDNWTEEQKRTWEEESYAIIERARIVEHSPKFGFIAGKRNIAVAKKIELADHPYLHEQVKTDNTLQQVYLVAVSMAGFYRVHPDWIIEEDAPCQP